MPYLSNGNVKTLSGILIPVIPSLSMVSNYFVSFITLSKWPFLLVSFEIF